MNIYFISGASGSGKTTIIPYLKKILDNDIAIYDFDDIGVPKNADTKWRQESTEKWISKLVDQNKSACLLGQMVLGEIVACPSAAQLERVNFCLLDAHDFTRIKRLKERNMYGADQNMLNWAAWLRMHTLDPQWHLHVIKDNAWSGLDFKVLEILDSWKEKAQTKIIDTTKLSLNQVAVEIADWIQKEK